MAQVSTDKIDEKIAELLTQAESYRDQERRLVGSPRMEDMAAHFSMRERSFAISVLQDLLNEAK